MGLLLVVIGLGIGGATSATAQAQIENAFPNLSFSAVTDIQAPPDGTDRLFVLERAGRIRVFDADSTTAETTTFLDIQDQVDTRGEGGLLGLAFHPEYAQNGQFFTYYITSRNGPFRSVVSRLTVSSNPDSADAASETEVLTVEQPYRNHNAGQLQFGLDGFLYVGLGDGGSGGDPEENGQDPTTLLGSMLRLDVDLGESGAAPDCGDGAYEVPSANPFVDDENANCDEIYAYGFRNPYRFSFGPEDRLWVADVGQNDWEEIDWVETGGNYGWDVMEGEHCYEPSNGCDTSGLELPVFEYSHSEGSSITGGYVAGGGCGYIEGRYVYGDYGNGRIWALSYDADGAVSNELLLDSSLSLTTFGVGPDDRLYLAGIFGESLYQFDCSTLPVELAGFSARIDGPAVRLTWQTASETNNAGFRVQRTSPGASWTQVGFVESKADGGTATEPKSYRFVDRGVPYEADRLTYRLEQIDTDGTMTFSEPVVVRRKAGALALRPAAPNPARSRVVVRYAVPGRQEVRLRLYDVLGREVRTVVQGRRAGRQETHIDVSGLPSGTYVLRLRTDDRTRSRRLTVVR
jgi:glucose/arabinose dehydrogenase